MPASKPQIPWASPSDSSPESSVPAKKPSGFLRILLAAVLVFLWLGVAGVGGPYFGKISEVSTNSSTDFLPESSESTRVAQQLTDFYDSDAAPAILIFESDSALTEADKTYLDGVAQQLKDAGVEFEAASPVISR